MAAAGGVAVGLAGYALSQQNLTRNTTAAAIAGVGLVLGGLASTWKPTVGAGVAGGGAAIAAGLLISEWYVPTQKQNQPSAMYGMGNVHRMANPQHRVMGAIAAPIARDRQIVMNGVNAGMGAVVAPISRGLQVELNGLS